MKNIRLNQVSSMLVCVVLIIANNVCLIVNNPQGRICDNIMQ